MSFAFYEDVNETLHLTTLAMKLTFDKCVNEFTFYKDVNKLYKSNFTKV